MFSLWWPPRPREEPSRVISSMRALSAALASRWMRAAARRQRERVREGMESQPTKPTKPTDSTRGSFAYDAAASCIVHHASCIMPHAACRRARWRACGAEGEEEAQKAEAAPPHDDAEAGLSATIGNNRVGQSVQQMEPM